MIATLAACGLAATTAVSLLGWWSASRQVKFLDAKLDVLRDEDLTAEHAAFFAGRCAHQSNVLEVPPIVENNGLAEHWTAGWDEEAMLGAPWRAPVSA